MSSLDKLASSSNETSSLVEKLAVTGQDLSTLAPNTTQTVSAHSSLTITALANSPNRQMLCVSFDIMNVGWWFEGTGTNIAMISSNKSSASTSINIPANDDDRTLRFWAFREDPETYYLQQECGFGWSVEGPSPGRASISIQDGRSVTKSTGATKAVSKASFSEVDSSIASERQYGCEVTLVWN